MRYYSFYTASLVRFIFSHTQCTSMREETFYKFWGELVNLLAKEGVVRVNLDLGMYDSWDVFENGFDELSRCDGFFYMPKSFICTLCEEDSPKIGTRPYNSTYAGYYLYEVEKEGGDFLVDALLQAVESIRHELTYYDEVEDALAHMNLGE